LAAQFPFETAIGINGRVWVKAGRTEQTIAMVRLIEAVNRGEVGLERAELEKAIRQLMA